METTHSIEHHSESMSTTFTIILWALAGFGQVMESFTLEITWIWIFRILSMISVLLVIIINYPKAKEVLFNKKKNDGNRKKGKGN